MKHSYENYFDAEKGRLGTYDINVRLAFAIGKDDKDIMKTKSDIFKNLGNALSNWRCDFFKKKTNFKRVCTLKSINKKAKATNGYNLDEIKKYIDDIKTGLFDFLLVPTNRPSKAYAIVKGGNTPKPRIINNTNVLWATEQFRIAKRGDLFIKYVDKLDK